MQRTKSYSSPGHNSTKRPEVSRGGMTDPRLTPLATSSRGEGNEAEKLGKASYHDPLLGRIDHWLNPYKVIHYTVRVQYKGHE